MLSLFNHPGGAVVDAVPQPSPEASPESSPEAAPESAAAPRTEFEIVLGSRQMASVLFLAVVIIVVFSAGAYLAGKSVSPRDVSAAAPIAAAPAATPDVPIPAPLPFATIKRGKQPAAAPAKTADEPPLFATPVPKKIYIQMAAVEKGLAMIFADGLRRRGLDGFVAPGPNEKLFRVLIGPLPDEASYKRVKNEVDQIGLNVFPRRYEQ